MALRAVALLSGGDYNADGAHSVVRGCRAGGCSTLIIAGGGGRGGASSELSASYSKLCACAVRLGPAIRQRPEGAVQAERGLEAEVERCLELSWLILVPMCSQGPAPHALCLLLFFW